MTIKHTLLFVDDEDNILSALRRLFRREGYEILTATSGPEGLALLQKQAVSLIISDQRMPEMIGAEFLHRAREICPHALRIMLTGFSDIETAIQAVNEGGIHRYISKPWDDAELKMTVRQVLERFELEERNRALTVELRELNAHLEQKVEERTRELQLKVKDLEGKDRIAQHLLTVHSLEETLDLVLEVISDILGLERILIYLKEDGDFKLAAAMGVFEPKTIVGPDRLEAVEATPSHLRAFAVVEERREPLNVIDPEEGAIVPYALVPILRGDEFLGFIQLDNAPSDRPITAEDLQTVASFALQTAVVISESQSHKDFSTWKEQVDANLEGLEDLEDLSESLLDVLDSPPPNADLV